MKKLKLSDELALPLDAVTQKLAWIGTTGSGKTYGASKLAELMWDAGAQFVVLDPVGVWYGLRLAQDGKQPSDLRIPIFGGLHGDVPLEPTGGALLANLVVDRTISVILDVSQFESDAQKARFAADFADRFFFRKKGLPSAVHLFIEECQEFIPEHQQRGEERMLHVFTRLQKIGRNFGIGTSLITQRPQEVAKKALNLAQTIFVFRTTGSHERKAIDGWIKDKAIADQDIASELPKLKTGRPHVWSPEWLELSSVVTILEKRSFNASATPEVGVAAVTRELAPIDLERIRSDMAATIEKAKAEDPKLLRDRIGKLERELAAAKKAPTVHLEQKVETQIERVLVPMLTEQHLGDLKAVAVQLQQIFASARGVAEQLVEGRGELNAALQRIDQAIARATKPQAAPKQINPTRQIAPQVQPPRVLARKNFNLPPAEDDVAALATAQRKLLSALAFLEQVGYATPSRTQVALFAGLSPTAGHTGNMFGGLRTAGLIEYPSEGFARLTEGGRALADPGRVPQTAEEMQALLLGRVATAQRKLLAVLIEEYPTPIDRRECAERAGLSPDAGHTGNMLGGLRSMGIIDYPTPGTVVGLPVLFLEGAA